MSVVYLGISMSGSLLRQNLRAPRSAVCVYPHAVLNHQDQPQRLLEVLPQRLEELRSGGAVDHAVIA